MDAQGIRFRVEGCNRCLCRRVNSPGINHSDSTYLPVVAMHDAHPFTRQSNCVRTGDVYAG